VAYISDNIRNSRECDCENNNISSRISPKQNIIYTAAKYWETNQFLEGPISHWKVVYISKFQLVI
jgi:hypothetical protein